MHPLISVIIPTYHDWERLKICIDALSKQTFPQDKFEVIIVNNDPENSPPELNLPDNFRIISEGKPGSYAARNTGIKEAEGEILAFTDSDCVPYKDWLEKADYLLRIGADRLAGKVELFYKSNNLTLAELYESVYAFDQKTYAARGCSVTANMITYKKLFSKIGGFNEQLLSGGDIEWGNRASKQNVKIKYAPEVKVKHPARFQIKQLIRKNLRISAGHYHTNDSHSINIFLKLIFRGYLPPSRKILKAYKENRLKPWEKLLVSMLVYFLKIISSTYKIGLLLGISSIKRS